jgi:hypothetical protein
MVLDRALSEFSLLISHGFLADYRTAPGCQMIDYPITRTSTNTTSSYWEPAWLNNTGLGSACQDAILFEPDWSHYPNVTAYSRKSVNLFNV